MGGSMGVTQGMLAEFGPERVRNTPISEIAIVGAGIGAAIQGMLPVVEIMYEDFLTISMEQIVNQAAKHRTMSGGQIKVPLTIRTQGGAGGPGRAARTAARGVVRPRARSQGRLRVDTGRRARSALVVDLRPESRHLLRAPDAVPDQARRPGRARADPSRKGARPPRGHRRDRGRNRPPRARGAESGGRRGSGRDLGRGRRPTHAFPARPRDDRGVGAEDDAVRHGARGGGARGLRLRARRGDPARRVRLSGCADRARRGEVRTPCLCPGDGELRRARRVGRARRDPRHLARA